MDIAELQRLDNLARERGRAFPKKRRFFNAVHDAPGKLFSGIVGSRGAGKTVLLRQLALAWDDSFYVSADTLEDLDLFETARKLSADYGVKFLLIDEIHFQANYAAALKKIYDFLNLRVVFTSSVGLSLRESAQDLSRRARMLTLHPFSFGEFVEFTQGESPPPLSLREILKNDSFPLHMRHAHLFETYLKGGIVPAALDEADILAAMRAVLETIVSKDIPSIARLHTDELPLIGKLLRFIGRSASENMSFNAISKNVGITQYKAEQYVDLLARSFVLNPLLPAGTNVRKEPKILMNLPFRLLYRDFEDAVGPLREDFAAQTLAMRGLETAYLKTKRGAKIPDFLVRESGERFVIEVGGKGKGRTQFKGIACANKLILSHSDEIKGNRRPLFLAGYCGTTWKAGTESCGERMR